MAQVHPTVNPFALMMDPESVLRALEASERLGRLKSRICRPLDKATITRNDGDAVAAFDATVEGEPVPDEDGETVVA